MRPAGKRCASGALLAAVVFSSASLASAQQAGAPGVGPEPTPPTGDFPPLPEEPSASPRPTGTAAPPPAASAPPAAAPRPAVAAGPAVAPAPAPPAAPAPYEPPAPGYANAPAPTYAVPPPPEKPSSGFERPEISLRVDPFNWLIEGRLGLELETEIWKIITLELVPVFVASESPPTFNYTGRNSALTQHSNGLGALAGTSVGAGFWFEGKPFRGYVLRAIFTNYGFTYRSQDDAGAQIDEVKHTERHFYVFLGSHNRWGAFTLAGGIGLGVELNRQKRCFPSDATSVADATSSCNKDRLEIALARDASSVADLNGPVYPVEILGRFSLGVVF